MVYDERIRSLALSRMRAMGVCRVVPPGNQVRGCTVGGIVND